MCNQTRPLRSLSLNSQLQLRNLREHVNVGLYFNLTLSPTEQHLQTSQQCLLRCFPLGRGGLFWSLPPSACLPFLLSGFFFTLSVWKKADFPSLPALLGCATERVQHSENLHFSHLRVFSLGGNLLSSMPLDPATFLILLKKHLAAPRVLAEVPHYTNLPWGPCPSAYSWWSRLGISKGMRV